MSKADKLKSVASALAYQRTVGADNRIEELEKENKLLGERCNQLLKDKGDLTDNVQKLEKENERLNKLYTLAKDVVKQFLNDCVITNDVLDKIEPLVKEMKIEY